MKVVGFLSLAVNMLNLTENQFKVNAINKIAQSGKVMEAVKKYDKCLNLNFGKNIGGSNNQTYSYPAVVSIHQTRP